MKFTSKIITCNEPNRNGRIYPRHVVEEALKEVDSRIQSGNFYGCIIDDSYDLLRCDMLKVSHRLLKYWWEGDTLMGEFETVETPCGKVLSSLLDVGEGIDKEDCMVLCGTGDVSPETDKNICIVTNYQLNSVDFSEEKA